MQFIDQLLLDNKIYKNKFKENKLFKLAQSDVFKNPSKKEHFLNYFQIWSNEFQRMVLARVVFSEKKEFLILAQQHLEEEFGHNISLSKSRANLKFVEDPILEAISNWFTMKMLTLSDAEKTVLVHLAVEACATIFYQQLGDIFKSNKEVAEHFECHNELDSTHEQIGIDALKACEVNEKSLSIIQKKAWGMLEALFTRLAEICEERD